MVVERDHHRVARSRAAASRDEVLEQVGVPAGAGRRTRRRRRRRATPTPRSRRGPRRRARSGALGHRLGPGFRDRALAVAAASPGARRAPCAGAARRRRRGTRRRPARRDRPRARSARRDPRAPRFGRRDQALAEAPDLVVGDVRVGQVLEAGVDRAQHPRDARRAVGGVPRGGRRTRWRPRAGSRPTRCAPARRGTRPIPSRSPRSRASARMYVPAEHATSTTAIGRAGSASSHSTRSSAWIVTSRAASTDRLARARQLVRAPALRSGPRCSSAGPG